MGTVKLSSQLWTPPTMLFRLVGPPPVFVPVGDLVKTVESVQAFLLRLGHIVTQAGDALKGAPLRCLVLCTSKAI